MQPRATKFDQQHCDHGWPYETVETPSQSHQHWQAHLDSFLASNVKDQSKFENKHFIKTLY
jgi:hypothetical protein